MNRKSGSRSGLFMMEMLVVVFFFILCAGICIMVYVRANNMSQLGQDTHRGVNAAQSLAEYLQAYGEEGLAEYFDGQEKDGEYYFYWDKDWQKVAEEKDAAYAASVSVTRENHMMKGNIAIEKGKTPIFQMDTLKYEK